MILIVRSEYLLPLIRPVLMEVDSIKLPFKFSPDG